MSDDPLTFSELRKIQKKEQRQDDLVELDEKFILRVSNYLDMKQETAGESREYKNARRVFDKIISLREEKITTSARIAVKSGLKPSKLNLLPSEKELYRDLKQIIEEHRERTGSMVEDDAENTRSEIEDAGEDLTEDNSREREEVSSDTSTTEDETETSQEPEVEPEPEEDETEQEESGEPEEEKDEEEEDKEGYSRVKITSDVPEFMGTDLETYGPFDEGEEVQIPEDNAEILINRGNAEEI
jgi:DNA replication initiation complex subunit (GINS family)